MNELDIIKPDQAEEILENGQSALKEKLKKDPNIQKLAEQIDHRDQVAILEYGRKPANEISAFSGKILDTIKSSSMEESSALLKHLGRIMDRFDPKDFAEPKGFVSKWFSKGQKMVEKLMSKYQTMGSEIDKVYVEIVKYEDEMKRSTTTLEQLYEQNFQYYLELEKHITAGELKLEELKGKLPEMERQAATGDQLKGMELDSMKNAVELMEQRVYDLELAKQVAYQSAPQIRLLQRGNTKLIGKINSAFVTTIPIFKTGLINAIAAKRQKLVADSMNELEKRTNEMLIKNAQNISRQSVDIARMAGSPSIKIETIEETWNIILRGMQETKAIEDDNKRIRDEGRVRLEQLQDNFDKIKSGRN
ncbi:toxic anion resistance protein [Metabacillus sp. GX 13764]|uniref:toxic anion resistance protein n=1 Tax=Metabacillus kandeliae TaxID=2900151 RepID=UPI001E4E3D37|nr:toxic anion resistance protein [Metabacillus kandeliae]MCD7034700.1 toxic anion resistance protein [Metabacillus kandeliae]